MPNPSTTKTTFMSEGDAQILDFNGIRLRLASPEQIHKWSTGEVLKPETINYRTQKPEKDGLFCEKIFGPSKDWECYCGKYKRIRYKGVVCDKCGVEVTRSIVRRERMGHIDLAVPVSHIWFLRGVPSKIGLVLDLSVQQLEKVIYFASYIIMRVDEDLRLQTLEQIKGELKTKKKAIEREYEERVAAFNDNKSESKLTPAQLEKELQSLLALKQSKLELLDKASETAKKELKELKPLRIISENEFQDLSLKYGHVFEAGIGAEAIHRLLKNSNLTDRIKALEIETAKCIPSKKKKMMRRLRLLKNLDVNKIFPDWMILTVLPVIPPDLRPIVQLDGGRFATSDLNDLYRRIINRNNRLKRLAELSAPEVIQRNEKRMLQEAVDALIDNGARHGKTVTASTGQKRMLKSIADMLKGKQGRFRQNLLGKRIDYSGRSVIVVGPKLQMHQCGLPKTMALELFRPFVISKLINQEIVHNVRSANRYIEQDSAEVWDILEEIISHAHVFLNRAPTLHRLGIQAFQPILIEGKAIQIHPMVCKAFNADFDGDQMAVHVPITEEAKKEAAELMLSTRNLLKPATGEPVASPDQDIVWGCYYLTYVNSKFDGVARVFCSPDEAKMAYNLNKIKVHDPITVRRNGELVKTTVGRLIFNEIIPEKLAFVNEEMNAGSLRQLVAKVLDVYDQERTANFLDDIKNLGYKTITNSGLSFGIGDIPIVTGKDALIKKGEMMVNEIKDQFNQGFLTNKERYVKVVEVWNGIKDEVSEISKKSFDTNSSLYSIINSKARGSWAQMLQIMGMKGLVINPSGEIIELPIKANFREGLDVLEYFISTHGTRKGLSDTALRTASAGYLTRRLVDVAQDLVVAEVDCNDEEGLTITEQDSEDMGESMLNLIWGRMSMDNIVHPETKKVIVKKGDLVTKEQVKQLEGVKLASIRMRSVITCKSTRGICQKCYGYDLGYNKPVKLGLAAGIVAAQSIGEPGTQLTMRTFHTGGVAGADITQGLPRVEELLEARAPKKKAIIAEFSGEVVFDPETPLSIRVERTIRIKHRGQIKEQFILNPDHALSVKETQLVKPGDEVMRSKEEGGKITKASAEGHVVIADGYLRIVSNEEALDEVKIPPGYSLLVNNGDLIAAGEVLTEGSLDLHELYKYKGQFAVQKYIIKEILHIYSSQGQKLNVKHIEAIVRQMFSRVIVKDAGDTILLPGEVITNSQLIEANEQSAKTNGRPAVCETLLLGLIKASLATDSFLSAASFQETARVLIDAAITGKVDHLRGLKENVIIGRLIPAGTGFEASLNR